MNNNQQLNNLLSNLHDELNSKIQPVKRFPTDEFGYEVKQLHYDELVKLTAKSLNKYGYTVIISHENGKDGKLEYEKVQQSNFGRFFVSSFTWDAFVGLIIEAANEAKKLKLDNEINSSVASRMLDAIKNDGDQFRTKVVQLFTQSKFKNKYTKGDDDFLFNHLYKDKTNNLYFEIDGSLHALRIKLNTETEILGNVLDAEYQFWPAFFEKYGKDIDVWTNEIRKEIESWSSLESDISIEEAILSANIVPRTFLEMLRLEIDQRGVIVGKQVKWYYNGCRVMLDNGSHSNWTMPNMIEKFSKSLLVGVNVNRVKTIPLFSNDETELAIKHLPRPVARLHQDIPTLPKHWAKYLDDNRFFDPQMDRLKIAHFIDNVLNAKYSGRQVLVIGGEGDDGKGVFMNILNDIIGDDYCADVDPSNFSPEDRFGLATAFNKKLLTMSDCKKVSTLFGTDKFKKVTGGDKLTLERKNQNQFSYQPIGLCVAMATNHNFYVNGEHGRTRVLPLVFRKNFTRSTQIEKHELVQMLLSEKRDFLQWCVDYKLYFQTNRPGLFTANSLNLCTDEDIDKLADKDADIFELFKKMCEKQTLNGRKFVNWNEKTAEDEENEQEENEIFDLFINDCFELWSEEKQFSEDYEDYRCEKSDIYEQWDSWTQRDRKGAPYRNCIKLVPRSPDAKKFYKYLQTKDVSTNHKKKDSGKHQCWGIRVRKE